MAIDEFYLSDFRTVVFDELPYFDETVVGNEYVYERQMEKIEDQQVLLRIYSSVDQHTEKARGEGKDAIRIKFETPNGNALALENRSYTKILRTEGWNERLKERANKYMSAYPPIVRTCSECHRPMILRKNKGNLFAGCSGWSANNPDCENTSTLN